jgi:hypothetical protein
MGLSNIDWTQLSGVAIALLIIGYLGGKVLDLFLLRQRRSDEGEHRTGNEELKKVIENNTLATNTLISFLQVTLTKNESSMEQVVRNTEHIPVMAQKVSDIWDCVKP